MFDFLCITPHASGANSLVSYLNQHRNVHVVADGWDTYDGAEESLRPWVKSVGIAYQNYFDPQKVAYMLAVTKHDLIIQTVRDPVESLVAQINRGLFSEKMFGQAGKVPLLNDLVGCIREAECQYFLPHNVSVQAEVDSFKEHIIVDIGDMRVDGGEAVIRRLWMRLCGDADIGNQVSNTFAPLGSRGYFYLNNLQMRMTIGEFQLVVRGVPDGQLRRGRLSKKNTFAGLEATLHTYPDASALLPSFKLHGALRICAAPDSWYCIHPKARPRVIQEVMRLFEDEMRGFNAKFAEAEKAMTFTLDAFAPQERALLTSVVADDFATFRKKHPAVADRWTVTREFLGV